MLDEKFIRMEMMIGYDAAEALKKKSVVIFGIGGVGSYAAEAIARSGIGTITLVDNDVISISNINRQLIATTKTIGSLKTHVMAERISNINPDAKLYCVNEFYNAATADVFHLDDYDYIIDAIDTVSSKLELIQRAQRANTPIISCMGTGNKLDPTKFQIADIYQTSVCPLAKVMRHELRKRGVQRLKVLYSTELPRKTNLWAEHMARQEKGQSGSRHIPGSISYVPPIAGMMIAGEVICDLAGLEKE